MSGNSGRRQNPDQLRARIRAEATRLFADHGYEATSVQAIADAVGISKQLLLYHCGSKEDLRDSVVAVITERWRSVLPELLDAATEEEGTLDGVLHALNETLEAHPDAARYIMRDLITDGGDLSEYLAGLVLPWMRVAAESIAKGQEDGRFSTHADPYATVVMVGISLLAQFAIFKPGSDDGDAMRPLLLKETTRLIRAALVVPSAVQSSEGPAE